MRIVNYKIIKGNDDAYIQNKVNECIRLGWVPQGGIAYDNRSHTFVQAMVRYSDDT